MIKAGIDYSMSSPAIAVWDDTKPLVFENLHLYNICDVKKYQGQHGPNLRIEAHAPYTHVQERYDLNAQWALNILKSHGVESVNLEGYAMGSTSGLVFNIAENTAHLKRLMWLAGIPYEMPSPGSVKKSFTGKGNAKKDAMCAAFQDKFGVDISKILGCKFDASPANDIVDSVAIMIA